jgi:lipoprotein-anchoring transpeptidase ErfK/SrfK
MHLTVLLAGHKGRTLTVGVPAMFAVLLAGATAVLPVDARAATNEASAANGLRLRASLGQKRLVVEDGGRVVRTFPIAVGLPSHPTPRGQFMIRRMIWNPDWVPPNSPWARGKRPRRAGDPANPMQAVKIFFREPTYYIHGTNDPRSIGQAASRGCIRMTPEDAAELGAYLMDHGGQPRGESWFWRVLRFGRSTVINLNNPIPLTITA